MKLIIVVQLNYKKGDQMKNKIIKGTGYIVSTLSLIFIGKSIMSMNFNIRYIKNPVSIIVIVILLSIGYAAVVYLSSYAWKMTLEFVYKGKIPFKNIINVYVKSNIGKYLPGNILHFVGRNILAGRLGFKQFDITFCSIVEIVMLIFSSCIVSLLFAVGSINTTVYFVLSKINLCIIFGAFICSCLFIVVAYWLLINKSEFIKKYRHLFTKKFLKLLFKLFCIYSATLIISGTFLMLILKMISDCTINIQMYMILISTYAISWVSGYIVPGSPGGIGVRESVLLLILAPIYSRDIALLASVLLRFTSISGDILGFILSYKFNYKSDKENYSKSEN